MTHLSPSQTARRPAPSVKPSSRNLPPLAGNPTRLHRALATKRAAIAALEAAWVAAAESDAARSAARNVRMDDRTTWDKPTWARYLAAAAAYQDRYLPRLRKLYSETARLEQFQVPLPVAAGRAA
jgi:hypothetical protein